MVTEAKGGRGYVLKVMADGVGRRFCEWQNPERIKTIPFHHFIFNIYTIHYTIVDFFLHQYGYF